MPYYTTSEVAKLLRVSTLTLKRWEKNSTFPKPIRINPRGDRRYKKEEVDEFLKNGI